MSALPCPVEEEKPFAGYDAAYAKISAFLQAEALPMTHSDLEQQIEKMGRELMRRLLQDHLNLRQPGEAQEPVKDAAGPRGCDTPAEVVFQTPECDSRREGATHNTCHCACRRFPAPHQRFRRAGCNRQKFAG